MDSKSTIHSKVIRDRCLREADYYLTNQSTVRDTAVALGVTKSTVYRDLTEILPMYSVEMSWEVERLLQLNKQMRALRGGRATALNYTGEYT
jgi:putative DeoR family transcriptional regulator (stage III sporulation protein D)